MMTAHMTTRDSPVPPELLHGLSPGERAALMLIAREAWRNGGVCTLTKPEISAILGCGRSVVRNALQFARDLDLISGKARHIEISPSWRRWLEQSGVAASP